jgi:hypothetical protein
MKPEMINPLIGNLEASASGNRESETRVAENARALVFIQ